MSNIQEEVEDKVIDFITILAGGRLVVFKPEGIKGHFVKDLAVEKKADYKGKIIFLNIYWEEDKINQLAEGDNFLGQEDFYLVFLRFDIVKQEIENEFLVVPSPKLKEAQVNPSKFLTDKKKFTLFLLNEVCS